MAHILALSNQKGGVAKTTTCMALGGGLVELGKKVLIVDLDSQSNLTLAAGLDSDELPWTIVDLFEAMTVDIPEAWVGAIYPTHMSGLDVLPSDLRLAGVERSLYDQPNYEQILGQILDKLEGNYDYILLDCPPSLGAITLMALTTASLVLVPVQCEYYAARGLSRLLDIVSEVQKRTNPNLAYHLLPTMYDKRNGICRNVLEQLQTHFPTTIFDTVIGVDTRLRESPVTGEPIMLYAPRTRATAQYRSLAKEVLILMTPLKKG